MTQYIYIYLLLYIFYSQLLNPKTTFPSELIYLLTLHSLPKSIISDRGPQFAAGLMQELNRMLEIKSKMSTVFHPQTDGQTERVNQELEQYLRMFIDYRQEQ